jgi:hypothetical protein
MTAPRRLRNEKGRAVVVIFSFIAELNVVLLLFIRRVLFQ